MKNGLYIDSNNQIEFMGAGQLSMGAGMKIDTRYSYDYSSRPQSLARRGHKTARTATITLQIARNALAQGLNLFDVVALYESIAGQSGELYWNEQNEGYFCVRGVSFSFETDAIDIVSAVQISLELAEGYRATKKQKMKYHDVVY